MELSPNLEELGIIYDPRFNFVPELHKYTWEGREMTGTTTVLKSVKNPDALLGWAANCAVDAMLAGLPPEEARKAHITRRDARKDEGTDTHALIEKWVKEMIVTNHGLPIAYMDSPILLFQTWAIREKIRFVASELPVYSEKEFVGGIIDFIYEKECALYLGDLKTNKKPRYADAMYPSYFFQVNGSYRMLFEGMGGKVAGSTVVRMNGKEFQVRVRHLPLEYENDKAGFLGALAVYRSTRSYEQQYK